MEKGEKARFTIAPSHAYGENGTGPIPANAFLIFEVELVDYRNTDLIRTGTNYL
jgi:FKBP-type peptidyl-prolyl cis-trans isomerase